MKIINLKQPYRRMAEYLAEINTNPRRKDKTILFDAFDWEETNDLFWDHIYNGKHPEITEEMKTHFPANFDFSSEEENLNKKYTQLAKEGKFDELPDTCEFSESVELEVWDDDYEREVEVVKILGKFKKIYLEEDLTAWNFAQLPTKKIDFSQFKTGDVVEVVRNDNEHIYGLLWQQDENDVNLTFSEESDKVKCIFKQDIKSITKIK